MKKFVQFFLFWMPFILGACTAENPGYHVEEYQEVKFEDLPEDVKVPSKAWDLMEFNAPGEEGHGVSSSTKNLIFSEVSVFLVQKNPGVVEGEAVKIQLPKGGGAIDLSRFITSQKGSFYVGFDFPAFEGATGKKVLFVSKARKRRIGEQIFGAGCNQFFDISEKFFKEMKKEGLKVNTTQERYLSVLGGTYFFAAQNGNDIRLAQVTFTNSQYKPLFCEHAGFAGVVDEHSGDAGAVDKEP